MTYGARRTMAAHAVSMVGSWWGIICSMVLVYVLHPVPDQKILHFLFWVMVPTIAAEGFKLIVKRPRPAARGEVVKVKAYGYSFPSSHTVAAVMVASWIISVPQIRWWSWLFILWPLIVGWSRVWLRAHDTVDVVGGILFGILSSAFLLHFNL